MDGGAGDREFAPVKTAVHGGDPTGAGYCAAGRSGAASCSTARGCRLALVCSRTADLDELAPKRPTT